MVISLFISAFSANIYMVGLNLFIFGFGLEIFFNGAVVYLPEVSSNKLRQFAPNILNMGIAFGQIVISMLVQINSNWRLILFVYSAFPIFLVLLCLNFLSESPRYYILKEKFK